MSSKISSILSKLAKLKTTLDHNSKLLNEAQKKVDTLAKVLKKSHADKSVTRPLYEKALKELEGIKKNQDKWKADEANLLKELAEKQAEEHIDDLQRRARDAWEEAQKKKKPPQPPRPPGPPRPTRPSLMQRLINAGKSMGRWVIRHPVVIPVILLPLGVWILSQQVSRISARMGEQSADQSVREGWLPRIRRQVDADLSPPEKLPSGGTPNTTVDLKSLSGDWVTSAIDRDPKVTMKLIDNGGSVSGTISFAGGRFAVSEGFAVPPGDYPISATLTEGEKVSGKRTYQYRGFQFTFGDNVVFKAEVSKGERRYIQFDVTVPNGPPLGYSLQLVRRDAPPADMPPRQD